MTHKYTMWAECRSF